jgi:hypothetical protein
MKTKRLVFISCFAAAALVTVACAGSDASKEKSSEVVRDTNTRDVLDTSANDVVEADANGVSSNDANISSRRDTLLWRRSLLRRRH